MAGGAVLGAAALTGCGAKRSGPLRVAVVGRGASNFELLLKQAGVVAPFPVEYVRFASGQLVIEAMNSGSIDLGAMSEIPPVFAAASAAQSFKQIVVNRNDVNSQAVIIPKGSTIKSLADLKGRKVGYIRATTSQYFLIQMLKSVGLTWRDIQPVAVTVADGAEAFASGALDAWAIYGYPIQRAVAKQGASVLKTALGFLSGNYLISATNDALADTVRADQIGQFINLLRKGSAWAIAHEEQWIAAVSADTGVPVDYVRDEFRHRSASSQFVPVTPDAIASQQSVADVFSDAALIPHRVDVKPLWDTRYNDLIAKGV